MDKAYRLGGALAVALALFGPSSASMPAHAQPRSMPAHAQPRSPNPVEASTSDPTPAHAGGGRAWIDPAIAGALHGNRPPPPPARRRRDGRVAVLIELVDDRSLAALASLAPHGVELRTPEGRTLAWERWVPARIDARGLTALEAAPFVRAVYLSPSGALPPLDRSAERIELAAARGAGRPPLPRFGRGVVIADLDGAIDVFHPAFFRADAGWYDWIDRNGDRRFTPGTDAIDLDRDGEGSSREIALVLRATAVDFRGLPTDALRRGAFDPSLDWLYLDLDGNGRRDVGAEAGFDDTTPALGEPLFVPDDLDGDGQLDVEERLVRLGTSKIRASYVAVQTGRFFEHVYRRGIDLATAKRDYTGGVYGYADTLHGSGVAGILLGDVPLVGRRWVGIAPEAELIHAFQVADDPAAQLVWVLGEAPDVVLHEYVLWTGVPLDGSDGQSRLIDDSTARGVAHVCPAGNLGGKRKHAAIEVEAGSTVDARFWVVDPVRYLQLTVHVRAEHALGLVLVEPSGAAHPFTGVSGRLSTGAARFEAEETTSRGFRVRSFTLIEEGDGSLPRGTWALRLIGDADAGAIAHAYLRDDRLFALSTAWEARMASDASTMAWPSTADTCLAVGAIPSHLASEGVWYDAWPEREGELRAYSARGPRIDGATSIGVVAPDNPWAPLGAGEVFPRQPGTLIAPEGAFQLFGGTSGAAPHVAAVAALLVESGLRGPAALDAIRGGAVADPIAGALPNDDYGRGRLSAARALGVRDPTGAPPRLALRAEPLELPPGGSVRLVPEASDEDLDSLELRWDDGYDGTWDTDYAALAVRELVLEHEGVHRFKAQVRDRTGRIAEAAARVFVRPHQDAGVPDSGPVGRTSGSGCGCRISEAGRRGATPATVASVLILWVLLMRYEQRTPKREKRGTDHGGRDLPKHRKETCA